MAASGHGRCQKRRQLRMSKPVADVLVETLQAAGVKRCYGIVGDTLNRIAHAIHESEIEWIHMRHEEAGAFAASAEAQFTGELTVCAGSGPGSLHFNNGLYEANRDRAPVILIHFVTIWRSLREFARQNGRFEITASGVVAAENHPARRNW
jgi:glyoxylate carboligase